MREFLIALSFFTRIPVNLKDVTEDEFFRSMNLMPIVGILIGLLLWLCAWLAWFIGYPPAGALIVILVYIWFTGGLHLDGVADTGDAVFSARDRETMFRIMKDSRLGTYGAVSLMLLILSQFVCFQWFISDYTSALVLVPVIGRAAAVQMVSWSEPAAGGGGLGKGYSAVTRTWIPVLYGILLFSAILYFYDTVILTAAVAALLLSLLLIPYFRKAFGGITGDHIGLSIELTQAVFMLLVIIITGIYY
ncbi:MAG: adenosylcobinamide-GDP ribazoletransferase [Eubacteriaceae bacterium]|jgi:adenosylcobinamide-GDP ribazoletransferase